MPAKKTFTMTSSKGERYGEPVAYTPIIFHAGTQTHMLALHRAPHGIVPLRQREWQISHPEIGAKIATIQGVYKGVPCKSNYLSQDQALQAAIHTLNSLCEKIGSERFNEVITRGFEKVQETVSD